MPGQRHQRRVLGQRQRVHRADDVGADRAAVQRADPVGADLLVGVGEIRIAQREPTAGSLPPGRNSARVELN